MSNAEIISVDKRNGIIELNYVDADEGSAVLDIKPYTPSMDRVDKPVIPNWCRYWPKSVEESGLFDWASEFNF